MHVFPTAAAAVLIAGAALGDALGQAGAAHKDRTPSPPAIPTIATSETADPLSYAQCLADLRAAGVVVTPLGQVTKEGCLLQSGVALETIASPFGDVRLPGKPTLTCGFARQFAGFVREVAAPLALAYTKRRLSGIDTGPGLVCRLRNNAAGGKPSEHARGNAIDIAGFRLDDGARVPLRPAAATPAGDDNLVKALRTAACGYFTTVLGPGADAAHHDHLHLDLGLHGRTANYRICE